MKILVDADACPVKEIILKIAKKCGVEVVMVCDTSHELRGFEEAGVRVITVDKSRDSADIALINLTAPGDAVVSQDYGVAAMALAKKAHCLNQNGLVYTESNIDSLLMERAAGQKIRRAGGRTPNPRRRTALNDKNFESALLGVLAACGVLPISGKKEAT